MVCILVIFRVCIFGSLDLVLVAPAIGSKLKQVTFCERHLSFIKYCLEGFVQE